MAHFYGSMQGSRGQATRCGTANSGFTAHIRGWRVGVEVSLHVDKDGNDVVTVYKTSGSSGHRNSELIGEFRTEEDHDAALIAARAAIAKAKP